MTLGDVIEPKNFSELMQAMPAAWTVLLGIALVVGLVLWVFGGRLAQKGVMLTGFVAGGLGATALATGLGGGDATGGTASGGGGGMWVLAIGIGGAIAGVLVAWLLFRFWMAGLTAVLLAAVVPIAAMIWEGNGPPLSAIQNTQDVTLDALGAGESDPAAERLREAVEARDQTESELSEASDDAEAEDDPGEGVSVAELFDREQFLDDLRGVWQQQVEEVKVWWQEMEPGAKRFLVIGAGIGGAIGLVLGLVMPMLAASLQSAMIGSVLIFFCGKTLLLKYVPATAEMMPGTWRGVLLSLGLITLLGVLIQWTLRKKKADD